MASNLILVLLSGVQLVCGLGWEDMDLSHVPWTPVTNRGELESGLEKGFSIVQVFVDNGTEYLHLGGDLHDFVPIIVGDEDSSPSSDLTLEYLLQQIVSNSNQRTGVHIRFLTTGILAQSLDILTKVLTGAQPTNVPILVEVNVLPTNSETTQSFITENVEQTINKLQKIPGVTPVLGWATYHGNDKVWRSLSDDGVLTRFQLLRIRRIIETLRFNPASVKDTDVRFLYFMSNKLESSDPHSFTLLAISQLLSAIKTNGHNRKAIEDPYAPRRAYRPPRKEPIREILPDYYLSGEGYTRGDVNGMLVIAKNFENVGFSLRAGMVKSDESVKEISRLLEASESRFLIVTKKKMDKEEMNDVSLLVDTVGQHKVFVEINEWLIDTRQPDSARVPEPRDFSNTSNNIFQKSYLFFVLLGMVNLIYLN